MTRRPWICSTGDEWETFSEYWMQPRVIFQAYEQICCCRDHLNADHGYKVSFYSIHGPLHYPPGKKHLFKRFFSFRSEGICYSLTERSRYLTLKVELMYITQYIIIIYYVKHLIYHLISLIYYILSKCQLT